MGGMARSLIDKACAQTGEMTGTLSFGLCPGTLLNSFGLTNIKATKFSELKHNVSSDRFAKIACLRVHPVINARLRPVRFCSW